ncbi:hypothetical protein EZS27_035032, partial [termite gut metagenome]
HRYGTEADTVVNGRGGTEDMNLYEGVQGGIIAQTNK